MVGYQSGGQFEVIDAWRYHVQSTLQPNHFARLFQSLHLPRQVLAIREGAIQILYFYRYVSVFLKLHTRIFLGFMRQI
jgi:hypothetical protein